MLSKLTKPQGRESLIKVNVCWAESSNLFKKNRKNCCQDLEDLGKLSKSK